MPSLDPLIQNSAYQTQAPSGPSRSNSGTSSPTTRVSDSAQIDFDVSVSGSPVTRQRRQAADVDVFIPKPGVARANLAVSASKPEGSTGSDSYPPPISGWEQYTVMQQHVLFWDRDQDGAIYPWDTFKGFRELGFNLIFCLLATVIINGGFSYPTRLGRSLWPDFWWRVWVGDIHKAKHGSDTGVYDKEGRFVPQNFEDMFSKWDEEDRGSLSEMELWRMIRGNRLAVDPYGWGAAIFEFGTTWLLLQKNGRVCKEDLRQTYDGTIFWKIKEARESGKGWNKGFGLINLVDLVRDQAIQRFGIFQR
ncbi:Caleosin related protein-domain-containing protein [Podospora fimiseda]|uniref:Caleosin related protein-domain-containing protein n=1 Tax=Podospora fimiseda TaxID=252190 RepID=A0AAN6YPA2_9PEZI|nr:Caleosin related protein-domain-containing protein [Podospora fimiseda]